MSAKSHFAAGVGFRTPTSILCSFLARAFYLGWGMHRFMMGIQARFGAGWGENVNLKSKEACLMRAEVF